MFELHFTRPQAADAFISMADCLWTNQRDDTVMGDSAEEAKLTLMGDLIDAVSGHLGDALTVILDDKFLPFVKEIVDSCADNAHDMGIDDEHDLEEYPEEAELVCCPWHVVITQQ